MENKVTCSVAMATYKGAKYVVEQLRSIEQQTVLPDEIVICDDVSPDDTVNVINEYAKNSKLNIKLFQNENNLGFRKNFEKAISLCTCDVVFLCDQDDFWLNKKVELFLKEFSDDANLMYAYSDAYVTDSELNITHDSIWALSNKNWVDMDTQTYFDYVQTRNFPLGFQAAARREFLFSIMPFLADHDGWIAMCAPAFGNVKAINEKLVYYRRHATTTSNAAKGGKQSKTELIKKLFKTKYEVYFVYPESEARNYACIADYAKKNNTALNIDEVLAHLEFLDVINKAKNRGFWFRIKSLKELKKNGLYYVYRGTKNTYILDCLFMLVNAFKRKKNR